MPTVPMGSFSADIDRLRSRISIERRTFNLHEDNAFIDLENTLVNISE